jgi:hypothetical protein
MPLRLTISDFLSYLLLFAQNKLYHHHIKSHNIKLDTVVNVEKSNLALIFEAVLPRGLWLMGAKVKV